MVVLQRECATRVGPIVQPAARCQAWMYAHMCCLVCACWPWMFHPLWSVYICTLLHPHRLEKQFVSEGCYCLLTLSRNSRKQICLEFTCIIPERLMHTSAWFSGIHCGHDNSMNPYINLPLTLGIVTFSTRATSELKLPIARYMSSTLVLNSKFHTYSVSVVLFTFRSRYTDGSTCLCAALILTWALTLSSLKIFGTTELTFLYPWDLPLCSPSWKLSN
jgi:hypothetical protein